jgi:SAM-dependent methyltransferase
MFSRQRIANAVTEVDQILKLANIPPKAHIMDLCCGVGRHSLELARRGFKVTAVDRTREYLHQAGEQAKKERLNIEFICEDMRDFCRPDTFNAAINLFTSFGFFDNPTEDRMVIDNVYRSLKPGGVLVVDMMGKEVLARVFRERDWHETDDGIFWLEERKVVNDWSRIESRWIMFKDDRRYEGRINVRLYSASELSALLGDCGFARVSVYGGFDGIPYDNIAKRLVVVGYKG